MRQAFNHLLAKITLLSCLLSITNPQATYSAEMRVSSNGNLYVIGNLVSGDFDRFKAALRDGGPEIGFVELRSPGGSVLEAMQIGRLVRSLYMNTNAPWSKEYTGHATSYCSRVDTLVLNARVPCFCASACFLIWSAGFFRYGDEVRIHRISFDKDFFAALGPSEAAAKYEQGLQLVRSYLQELRVPEKYYELMLKTPSYISEKISWSDANRDFGFQPIAAMQEWLIARCGGFAGLQGPPATRVSECWMREQKNIQREAIQKFLSE